MLGARDQVPGIEAVLIGGGSAPQFDMPQHAEEIARIRQSMQPQPKMPVLTERGDSVEYAVVYLEGMMEAALHFYARAEQLNVATDGDVL